MPSFQRPKYNSHWGTNVSPPTSCSTSFCKTCQVGQCPSHGYNGCKNHQQYIANIAFGYCMNIGTYQRHDHQHTCSIIFLRWQHEKDNMLALKQEKAMAGPILCFLMQLCNCSQHEVPICQQFRRQKFKELWSKAHGLMWDARDCPQINHLSKATSGLGKPP